MNKNVKIITESIHLARIHYWIATILPAIIGTTLPFWLNPPDYKFKLFEAVLFLIMTVLGHAGFSLLHAALTEKFNATWTKRQLIISGIISLFTGILVGLVLNSSLQFHKNVPEYIFIVYGILTLFIGVLYVVPPFNFYQHIFGEVVICVGLGMMPVLGAYLVQVGDLTRTVYLASLPVVISTCLWLWITELISKTEDECLGYKTTVMYSSFYFSSCYVTLFLIILIYLSLVLAVIGRSSLNSLSLIALLSIVSSWSIIRMIWKDYEMKCLNSITDLFSSIR